LRTVLQDIIRKKLDQVDGLYPPERLALSRQRWTRLWRGEPPLGRYPFQFAPHRLEYYSAGSTPEDRLHDNLDEIIARGVVQDDFIPSFFTGCRQSTIPSMFGAEEVVLNGDYTCRQIIKRPEDIDDLPEPSLGLGTVPNIWLEMQAYVLDATEHRLPVHVTDMQGPADVCGQLMGYEAFLSCAYEDTTRYHRLMGIVTEAFISFWDAQRRLCGDCFVGTHLFGWNWVPADAGAALSADSLVMISPAFYKKFYQPYIERIGNEFGGVAVHSCGDFSTVIPALCATPTLKAVNAGQMTLDALCDAGVDSATIAIGFVGLDRIEDLFRQIREKCLRVDLSIGGVWPVMDQQVKPAAAWSREDRAELKRIEERVTLLATDAAGNYQAACR